MVRIQAWWNPVQVQSTPNPGRSVKYTEGDLRASVESQKWAIDFRLPFMSCREEISMDRFLPLSKDSIVSQVTQNRG